MGATVVWFYLLIWSLNMWGMGRFVYWNVKYYLFCRKLCPSQREMWLPVGFSLLFYKITFCMSSLLFDCYLNGLSVCLVLVVNLLWQHLMFLLLLPNHLSYTSKVNAHSFFSPTEYFVFIDGYKFFCLCVVFFLAEQMTHSENPQTDE